MAVVTDESDERAESARHEYELDEALDEVERLRGENERLQVEKHALTEQLIQMGSDPS